MDRDKLKLQLIMHEGLRLTTYRCPGGKLTIGIGHNLDADGGDAGRILGRPIMAGSYITREEALELLEHDIDCTLPLLKALYLDWDHLSDNRQRVLTDMCFNLGIGGLKKFNKMNAMLMTGDYHEAAYQMLDSRWAAQVGKRAERLARAMSGDVDPLDVRV